jgi:hypothetical protein
MTACVGPTSSKPGAEQVYSAGEEASLEYTKQRTAGRQLAAVLGETHANHDATPQEGNDGEMYAGADQTNQDSRGRLEDDIRDEEDEISDVLNSVSEGSNVPI